MADLGDRAGPEFRSELASSAEWRAFLQAHPDCILRQFIEQTATRIAANGFYFGFEDRQVAAAEMHVAGKNYRETFAFHGINARQRAVLDELLRHLGTIPAASCRIYSPEALSDFALLLRGRFARFIGSEYSQDAALRHDLYPIAVESLLDLSLPPDRLDAVLVNDVFEHIPDIPRALAQICRVLRPGGALLSTFPFAAFSQEGHVKAVETAAGTRLLTEPEFHQDPLSARGALVYQIPGWNILDDCRRAGYADAKMVYIFSEQRGIIAPDVGGIFVLRAIR